MNNRERVISAVEHRTPDRIPVAEHFWEDTLARWYREGLRRDITPHEYFDFDICEMGIDASPRFKACLLSEDDEFRTIRDRFGYVAKMYRGKSRTLDYISYPARERKSWDKVKKMFVMRDGESARTDDRPFPFRIAPAPSWEEAGEKYRTIRKSEKYILGSAYGPHEAVWRLHGFTGTLVDIALDPGFIAEISSAYTDFLLRVIDRCLEEGIIFDGVFLVEDLAGTRGMIFSPEHWRSIYKPQMMKIGAFLKERKLHFWMHSCGNSEVIFTDLIECGVEVINPLEVKSGLDIRELKKKYGGHLAFYGNIDVRTMMKTETEIEREIQSKLTAFHRGGGYIFHSDHSIPPEVSFERYLFVLKCARRFET